MKYEALKEVIEKMTQKSEKKELRNPYLNNPCRDSKPHNESRKGFMLRRMGIPKMVFTQEPLSKVEIKKEPFKNFKELLEKMENANFQNEAIEFIRSHHSHFVEEIRSGLKSTNASENFYLPHYTPPFPEHIPVHRHKK